MIPVYGDIPLYKDMVLDGPLIQKMKKAVEEQIPAKGN